MEDKPGEQHHRAGHGPEEPRQGQSTDPATVDRAADVATEQAAEHPDEHETADPAARLTRYGQLAAELEQTRAGNYRCWLQAQLAQLDTYLDRVLGPNPLHR